MYLQKKELKELLDSEQLIIRPILEPNKQINEMTVDFRLGYNFLVAIQGREAYVDSFYKEGEEQKLQTSNKYFQETRRKLGETFLLHPNQVVLATSLEYIKLPNDIFMVLNMRSSYARLGITISTIIQPGYCGCVSLELLNNSQTPINLAIGARVFQARFSRLSEASNYFSSNRKYICNVRPEVSAINQDSDILILKNIENL